jgi:catechol 2,3-dioxygenase-like lactoylglutathione lyase family enzyme
MKLRHVALTYTSEKNSDRLFMNLLGLEKLEPKTLAISLSKAIFNVNSEILMINYRSENAHFEIFITEKFASPADKIGHVCVEVEDLEAFLDKCRRLDADVFHVPKGDRTLTFLRDDEGHLFEIK